MMVKVILFSVCLISLVGCKVNANVVKTTHITKAVELTEEDKQGFIDHHNYLRAEVDPPAMNMQELEWDEDLAEVAKSWTRKCIFGHNKPANRKTAAFSYTGENMYFRYPPMPQSQVLKHSLDRFMREKRKFTYGVYGGKRGIGHYTQMMWANTNKVGCGVTNCGNLKVGSGYWANAQVVACNYGPGGNVKGQFPWEEGQSCENCPPGKKCLCSAYEMSIP